MVLISQEDQSQRLSMHVCLCIARLHVMRLFIVMYPQCTWVKSKRFASLPLLLACVPPFIAGSFPTLVAERVPSRSAALQRCRPLLRLACFSSEFGKLAFIADHFVGSSRNYCYCSYAAVVVAEYLTTTTTTHDDRQRHRSSWRLHTVDFRLMNSRKLSLQDGVRTRAPSRW